MAGVPKVALDFLLRPATMTSRSIPVPRFLQDGENSLGDGNTIAAWEGTGMAVWLTRWLQCADTKCANTIRTADGIAITIGNDVIAPLRCEEFTLLRAEIVTDAGTVGTPTNDRRDNVLRTRERAHALNHGGAID